MKQAVRTEPEDRYGEIARWIQAKALRMGDDKEFAPLFAQSMDRIRDAGPNAPLGLSAWHLRSH